MNPAQTPAPLAHVALDAHAWKPRRRLSSFAISNSVSVAAANDSATRSITRRPPTRFNPFALPP